MMRCMFCGNDMGKVNSIWAHINTSDEDSFGHEPMPQLELEHTCKICCVFFVTNNIYADICSDKCSDQYDKNKEKDRNKMLDDFIVNCKDSIEQGRTNRIIGNA